MQTHATPMPGFPLTLPVALSLAGLMTAGLFYLMQELIRFDGQVPELVKPATIVDFVRLIEEEIEPPIPEPTPPEPVKPPPPTPIETAVFDGGVTIGAGIPAPPPIVDHGPQVMSPDGDALPIVTAAPEYPRSALMRGIEGYVVVGFSIDERGQVIDAVVVDADPEGVFDRSALAAIARYRYKPRIVGGAAVRVDNLYRRLSYELTR